MTARQRRARAKQEYDAFLTYCPSRQLLARISDKWVALVLAALGSDGPSPRSGRVGPSRSLRYSELSRRLAGVSQKMLTQTLRSLERDGLLTRTVTPTVPVTVSYELTQLGLSLQQVMLGLKEWAEAHMDEVLANRADYDAALTRARFASDRGRGDLAQPGECRAGDQRGLNGLRVVVDRIDHRDRRCRTAVPRPDPAGPAADRGGVPRGSWRLLGVPPTYSLTSRVQHPGRRRRGVTQFLRDNSLSVACLVLFLVFGVGLALTGHREFNADQVAHGEPTLSFWSYLVDSHFWQALSENWESEFLQMGAYVLLTVFLVQKGSAESKDPDEHDAVDDDRADRSDPHAPWPVRRGGLWSKLYENSLVLAFAVLFLASFVLHAVSAARTRTVPSSRRTANRAVTTLEYFGTARFWFESFQNWQSEFLAVFAIVVLTIFLRQRGSRRVEARRRAPCGDERLAGSLLGRLLGIAGLGEAALRRRRFGVGPVTVRALHGDLGRVGVDVVTGTIGECLCLGVSIAGRGVQRLAGLARRVPVVSVVAHGWEPPRSVSPQRSHDPTRAISARRQEGPPGPSRSRARARRGSPRWSRRGRHPRGAIGSATTG